MTKVLKTIVVIPAYNPGEDLLRLAGELGSLFNPLLVVVNDGSGPEAGPVFDKLDAEYGAEVLHHPHNLGKGAALKSAAALIAARYPGRGYVTADADFQHLSEDIFRVAKALEENPECLVLGVRDFSAPGVPFKSRWGNRITQRVFRLVTGISCRDTQTGLRGIPAKFAEDCARLPGDRFEYEMNMLFRAVKILPLLEVPVTTVYREGNRSSTFRPLRDSARIYLSIIKTPGGSLRVFGASLLKFSCSSVLCAVIDLGIFSMVIRLLPGLSLRGILAATVTARLASGVCNFSLNRFWVFAGKRKTVTAQRHTALKYFSLFCGQMFFSWFFVSILSALPLHLTFSKALVDTCLFFLSYHMQRKYIFPQGFSGGESLNTVNSDRKEIANESSATVLL